MDLSLRAAALALVFIALEADQAMTRAQQSRYQFAGETVTVSFVADPSVGHGHFRLENHGPGAVTAAVISAWLVLEGRRRPLASVSLFDLGRDQAMNPEGFEIEGESEMSFLLGFPKVDYNPHFGESGAVGLRLRLDGAELQASSPLKFVRRIPRGH